MLVWRLLFAAAMLGLFLGGILRADEMDKGLVEALLGTQEVLKDQKARANAADTPEAKAALGRMEILGGNPENTEAMFQLSAEIFADLAKQTKGDPGKMQEILEKAYKNPSQFAESLSPEIKAKLKTLAAKVPQPAQNKIP